MRSSGTLTDHLLRDLNEDVRVEYAELNYVLSTADYPDDSQFDEIWSLNNTGQTGGTPDADIDAPEAWSMTTGSSNIIVAVIDTGVDYSHPDLLDNIWANPGETGLDANGNDKSTNGIDDDGNGYVDDVHGINAITNSGDPMDDHGHGTHTAGTVGATGNNGKGITGVDWNVSIAACKFLDSSGSGSTADAVKCFQYFNYLKNVRGEEVLVTNNSWGGGGFSQALEDAMAGLDQPGIPPILHVVAAGNSNNDNDVSPQYPASYPLPNIVAVAATDDDDIYASFSSYGATSVDLAAPGVNILSTVPTGACLLCDPSGYHAYNGTSMATPHVAGAAGLIWSLYPGLSAGQVKQRLLWSGDYIGDKGSNVAKPTLTNSRLNAFSALEDDSVGPDPVTDLAVSGMGLVSATLTWTATGEDGSTGTASAYDLRYATSPITDATWDSATRAVGEPPPQPAGSSEVFQVSGLDTETNYYFTLKVVDNVGNASGLSNGASGSTLTGTEVFQDDMESGPGGWTATGLWHQTSRRQNSLITSWWYGIESQHTYDTGATNNGTLTSSGIDLSEATRAILTFYEWSELEGSPSYDRTRVQLSTEGTNWATVFESHETNHAWVKRTIDLTPYIGATLYLRFWFDTIDSKANDYEGWYVDDLRVVAVVPNQPPSNNPPQANAGGPYSGTKGTAINLDASGSFDLDGDPLTYTWDFGDSTAQESATTPSITHTYSAAGTFTVTLVVNDGTVDSSPDQTGANVANQKPVANAGGPYNGTEGLTMSFDGSGSFDPDGDPLSYAWDFGDSSPSTPTSSPTISHSYSSAGTYTVTLVVNDGTEASSPAQTTATVDTVAPPGVTVSSITPNTIKKGTTITSQISGSGFEPGAVVSFENGSGPSPAAFNVAVLNGITISLDIAAKGGGPPRDSHWDVRVTNPDGASAVLNGLTISP